MLGYASEEVEGKRLRMDGMEMDAVPENAAMGMPGDALTYDDMDDMGGEARGGYVLVIDDDPAVLSLLTALLRDEEGFAVRAAYSIGQALAQRRSAPPALILLDLAIADEDVAAGVRNLRQVRGWERIPIILCSGQADIAAQAKRLGAIAYLTKPFDLDVAAALARAYLTPHAPEDVYH